MVYMYVLNLPNTKEAHAYLVIAYETACKTNVSNLKSLSMWLTILYVKGTFGAEVSISCFSAHIIQAHTIHYNILECNRDYNFVYPQLKQF